MLRVLCVLLLLVGLTFAAEPRKCCFDKEFTAVLGEVGGRVVHGHAAKVEGSVQLAYDYYRARQGSINNLMQEDGSFQTIYVLQDYANRITYTRVENKNCTAKHMAPEEQMYPPCIPDDATFVGTATFGYGTETIDVHTWEFMLPQTGLRVKLAVNQHCVPFAEAVYGNSGGADTETTLFFTSYHPGVEDLDVLNLPTDCTFMHSNHTDENQVGRRAIHLF